MHLVNCDYAMIMQASTIALIKYEIRSTFIYINYNKREDTWIIFKSRNNYEIFTEDEIRNTIIELKERFFCLRKRWPNNQLHFIWNTKLFFNELNLQELIYFLITTDIIL